jgi:hypothetical protein
MTYVPHPNVKCHFLKLQEKGPGAAETCPDPVMCIGRGQIPQAARKENAILPQSSE